MIDFHTHILPGLDDGAKSVAISAGLLQMEADQGVKEIVFTPHYYAKKTVPRNFWKNAVKPFPLSKAKFLKI